MFQIKIGGKSVRPENLADEMMKLAAEKIKSSVRQRFATIRLPTTGEFPTVLALGDALDNLAFRIEGSPELIELVRERLSHKGNAADSAPELQSKVTLVPLMQSSPPKVFLSYASADVELVERIATVLSANGIEPMWDRYSIGAGDSPAQKINEDIVRCTHFMAVLTPSSIDSPWVRQEIEAAFVRKVEGKLEFIPVRSGLAVTALSPLLRSMHSPSIDDFEPALDQIVNDIRGITRRPPVAPAPEPATPASTGYSEAANKVAKLFVMSTKHARTYDPQISLQQASERTQMSLDDVRDAVHELNGLLKLEEFDRLKVDAQLFAEFDRHFLDTDPRADARRLAADLVNDSSFPESVAEIGKLYGWEARRLNPAISYLIGRNLIYDMAALDSGAWVRVRIRRTDATRRFVKS